MSDSVKWGALRRDAEEAMKPLAEGTQVPVIVETAEYARASTGSNMIKVKLAVTEGPHANRKFINNFVLSPDSAFATNLFFANMAVFGITDAVFAELEKVPGGVEQHLTVIANALVGRRALMTMAAPRVFQGVARDNPGSFTAVPGQPPVNIGNAAAVAGAGGGAAAGPPSLGGVGAAGNAHNQSAPGEAPSVPSGSGPTVGAAPTVGSAPPVPPSF